LALAAVACAVAAFWPRTDHAAQVAAHAHEDGSVHADTTAAQPAIPAGEEAVTADTVFEYVAVFAQDTPSRVLDRFRQLVLVRVHQSPCVNQAACLARLLRSSELGPNRLQTISFDLQGDTPDVERQAILAAAVSGEFSSTILFAGMSANAAVSRYATLPVSLMAGQAPISAVPAIIAPAPAGFDSPTDASSEVDPADADSSDSDASPSTDH